MALQYKCPDCGADMVFDSTSGMLSCNSCGRKEPIASGSHARHQDADPTDSEDDIDEVYGDFEEFQSETASGTFGTGEASQYQCNNCGAILITDPDTTATTCSFCGAAMVLDDRLQGSLAPARVIPFTINKAQAQEAFKKWCRKGRLTPRGFMTAERVKNITGMYIPFWLYDLNGQGVAEATCTRVRTYTRGDYIYTETRYYDVYRKVDLDYEKIPADASEKMNDMLMDRLEPYNYTELKEFNAPYLAGYLAEKYNYTDKELFPRVQKRTEGYVDSYIRSTISGYSTTTFHRKQIDIKQRKAYYTLLPIWMICYDYKQSEHTFAMNGQTGKIVGKPPLSMGKIAFWFGGISASLFLLLKAAGLYLGGGWL